MNKQTANSDAILRTLEELVIENPKATNQSLANKINDAFGTKLSADSVRKKLKSIGMNKRSRVIDDPRQSVLEIETTSIKQQEAGTAPIISDRKNAGDPTIEFIDALIEFQSKLQESDERQTELHITIPDNKPIGVIMTGDWHFGGLNTDHQGMREDFKLFKETEGLYGILMGDYSDNVISGIHPGAQYEQIINPDVQREGVEYLVRTYFRDRTLAVIKGNHDNWQVRSTGDDFVRDLSRAANSAYLWYGGNIHVGLGDQTYKIHARHNYKYNSSINTTNSQRNLYNSTHADVIALGHIHHNEKHEKTFGGNDTIWFRTGSYKITDDFSQWIGGYTADPRVPMVVLWPDKKKKIGFRDFRDGIVFLKTIREQY